MKNIKKFLKVVVYGGGCGTKRTKNTGSFTL